MLYIIYQLWLVHHQFIIKSCWLAVAFFAPTCVRIPGEDEYSEDVPDDAGGGDEGLGDAIHVEVERLEKEVVGLGVGNAGRGELGGEGRGRHGTHTTARIPGLKLDDQQTPLETSRSANLKKTRIIW